jgi:hypothetical protein
MRDSKKGIEYVEICTRLDYTATIVSGESKRDFVSWV